MTNLVKLAAIAAISAPLLIVFVPVHDAVASVCRPALSREALRSRAAHECTLRGVDVSGWGFAAIAEFDRPSFEDYVLHPTGAWARDRRGFLYRVTFHDGIARRSVRLAFSASGTVISFTRDAAGAQVSPEAAALTADQEFVRLAGPLAGLYRPTSRATPSRDGLHFSWDAAGPSGRGSVSRITAVVDSRGVLRSEREEDRPESMRAGLADRYSELRRFLSPATLVVYYTIVTAAFWVFFMLLGRNPAHLKFGLRLALLLAAGVTVDALFGTTLDNIAASQDYAEMATATRWGIELLGLLLGVTYLTVTISAGYGRSAMLRPRAWIGLHLASRGLFWSSEVGLQTLAASLGGVTLALLIAAPTFLPGATPGTAWTGAAWVASNPVLEPLKAAGRPEVASLFGFLIPLLVWYWNRRQPDARPWRQWLAGTIVLAAGALLTARNIEATAYSLPESLLGAVFVIAWLWWLYRSFGLLTVGMAWPFATAWSLALIRFHLGDPARLRESVWLLGAWGCVALASLLVWRLAPRRALDAERRMLDELGQPSRSEREWLNAQFHVARQAQQTMLPVETPQHEVFTIAVSSTPAREVGGDLYDFLHISEHRKCFLLGDVSGKGVAAALYMTLTKGMLAASSADALELPGLFERLNRHFLASGRRRMFLTLSGGILDGESMTLTHLRAGHPPALLCRAADGKCDWLKPRGIGIGLVAGGAFGSTLETERIQLEPGDVLVYYSDGLTECMNERQEQFGEERIQTTVLNCRHASAETIEGALREAAARFRGPAEPHDDLTILVVKMSGNQAGAAAAPLC